MLQEMMTFSAPRTPVRQRALFGALAGKLGTVQGNVSTFGWDSVFAISIPEVNETIRAHDSSPGEFAQDVQQGYSIKGSFKPWQIGSSGDGVLIHIDVPVTDVTAVIPGQEIAVPEAIVTAEVRLKFVPHDPMMLQAGALLAATEIPFDLVIDTGPPPMMLGADGFGEPQKAATVMRVRYKDGRKPKDPMTDIVLQAGIEMWLNENLDKFAHVFATVNLARQIGDGAFEWMKPTYVSYSFLGADEIEDCVLSILCLSEDRTAKDLYETVSPGALPKDGSATFVISGQRLLDEMIRKALPQAFKGLKETDLNMSEDGRELTVDRDVPLKQIDHDGKQFDAVLQYLNIRLDGSEIRVKSHTETEVSPGVFSICDAMHRYTMILEERLDGKQGIAFKLVADPEVHSSTRHSKEIDIIKWIVRACAVIVSGVVLFLTWGTGWAFSIVLVALAFGLFEFAPDIVAAIHRGDAPPIDLMVANATAPFRWAGQGLFKLTNLVLNESLLLYGRFVNA